VSDLRYEKLADRMTPGEVQDDLGGLRRESRDGLGRRKVAELKRKLAEQEGHCPVCGTPVPNH
jgi:DNA repair exonuclease SbcCD ATPase subunit